MDVYWNMTAVKTNQVKTKKEQGIALNSGNNYLLYSLHVTLLKIVQKWREHTPLLLRWRYVRLADEHSLQWSNDCPLHLLETRLFLRSDTQLPCTAAQHHLWAFLEVLQADEGLVHFQQPFDDVFVPNSLFRKDELRFRTHLPEFELQCVLGELKKVLQIIVKIARKRGPSISFILHFFRLFCKY